MIEEQYLVYQCYGITQGEKEEDIIQILTNQY